MLEVGQKAPDFNLLDENGENMSLSTFKGKNIVLYFYPKDDTPGCTKESIAFSELKNEFEANNTVMLGASKDSVKKHQNFIKKFDFPFPLLADTEQEVLNLYGVWGEKQMYGRKYMGVFRTTFIIDEKGVIEKIFTKVKTAAHTEQILEGVS